MKFFTTAQNLKPILANSRLAFPSTSGRRAYSVDPYPYTTELYRKNYIKYPVQSRPAIAHDYVFHDDERLPTFAERMKDFKDVSEELTKDIGKSVQYNILKELKQTLNLQVKKNKADKLLEKKAKDLKLSVPIDKVEKQSNLLQSYKNILAVANHYNINKDLFEQAYFQPCLDLNVEYSLEDQSGDAKLKSQQVFYGNMIPTKYTKTKPKVSWEDSLKSIKEETIYHSLFFFNLDGNFQDSNNDVLLWLLGNVKNGDVSSGNEVLSYIQPFPMRGSGWHRCVYVLFEHKAPVDFKLTETPNTFSLQQRSLKMSKLYSTLSNELTPVGLSFFQAEWDLSVRDFFHNQLNMKEPVYEFDFGQKFVPKYEKYPRGHVFNWYLQEYMDKKVVHEQVLKDYLKDLSPFEAYPEPAKYPILDVEHVNPKWYKYEMESYRKRRHQWSLIPFKYSAQTKKVKEQIKNLPYQQK